MRPAQYFPVKPTPFRFQAGLLPFGTDAGNGEVDMLFFQMDSQRPHYLSEKRRVRPERHHLLERDEAERRVHRRILPWIRSTLEREHPDLFAPAPATYRAIAAEVQEDLVVLHRRADGSNAAILVDVRFPSDWDPDRIVDTDFQFIHGPVPGFADRKAQARSMVSAMIDRGPYVRFVWTLKPDDRLDHHPGEGPHPSWNPGGEGFLRVERQITVPFADVGAALFLIRTYLYPFASLPGEQRRQLRQAVESMPPEAARYKGFLPAKTVILALLDR